MHPNNLKQWPSHAPEALPESICKIFLQKVLNNNYSSFLISAGVIVANMRLWCCLALSLICDSQWHMFCK